VGTGATLQASGVNLGGNIQAEGAANVTVSNNSSVGGSIQIKQGEAATVIGVQVNGDILFDDNSSQIVADNNVVGGNLQAFQNTGGLAILNNRIDGNLQCKENNPAPVGSNNQAASLEDQCADLDVPSNPGQPLPPGGNGTCQTSIGNQTFENLSVPNGQTCILNGTSVTGNIIVGTASTLHASGVIIGGNIQAEGAANVFVVGTSSTLQTSSATNVNVANNSLVGGSIWVKQSGGATIAGVQVDGDIQFDANNNQIVADNNVVGGNLQAFNNAGRLTILNNRIDGSLQCNENDLAPMGGNNQATSTENQCASLKAPASNFTKGIYLPALSR
jgi:hypothetical protein